MVSSHLWCRRLDSHKADEKRIQSAELWIYRRMLRVSWTEHRTDESTLTELGTTRQLLGFVVRRKLYFFRHTIRDGGCELAKCEIQGKVSGKRRRGRPNTSYSSNITKWTSVSTERITRETRDRAGWRKLIRCAARAADHHSWWDRERRREESATDYFPRGDMEYWLIDCKFISKNDTVTMTYNVWKRKMLKLWNL